MNFLDHFKNKRVLSISHNDLDGVLSTVLCLHFIQPLTKDLSVVNTDKYDLSDQKDFDKQLKFYDVLLFTDFSPDVELYNKLKDNKKEIVIVDHHITAHTSLKNIALDNYYYYDPTRCGTKILLDEIAKCVRIKKVVFQAVELCNIYDLYQMKSALWRDAKGLSNILWGMCNWKDDVQGTDKYINFIQNMLNKFKNESVFFFSEYEKKLVVNAEAKEQSNLKEAKRNLKIRTDNQGNTYGYFECESKNSIVSNYLLNENENLKYTISHMTFKETPDNIKPKVSIRSIEGRCVDCSLMASLWGGGGHIMSSGIDFKNFDDFQKLREGKMHLI